ncbi:type II CRISPR-associated endonuclease Cas1 [Salisediminibacterium halotolerans]|uniref:type II CRISPR-associated endonuclease Cas1 n=1 Tax=Salisediminibacterium halotolerans TaxID=517425 RepID=UPI000EADCCB4|nr:type II CRISPR-associated endonuclease Cas1 [Salisediminibacterium halotolerans]RLJ71694.1 CRISPR-associated protein Cas1 [Actinophytocola xinjiangensis]RPE86844.1 CRISPR-associated protein Cas1 [Salisediminibacterium halotolerans]TWG32907.1 CRISPR-associated protein Cas1 [Salisediminibacterium halotolerans]GEL07761.1 CRISPR-associated endonuclease Cas1 [Salisediminibacterium halotolerans]
MSWRVVHITNVEQMSLHLDSLKIKRGDEELKIPLADIFSVIIEDLTCKLTSRLMVELSKNNILVLICGQQHLPESQILPISGHFGQHKRMIQQLNWNEDQQAELWGKIIGQKIYNQARVMERNQIEQQRVNRMYNLISEIQPWDQENCEAQAARLYFNSFWEGEFSRNDPDKIENAALNYGYAIFHAALGRTITAKGLLPGLGIFHKGERNPFNLASDLIEPLRPIVDAFVLDNPPEDYLTKEYRLQLINLLHARVMIDGKLQTVIRTIDIYLGSIIEYFDTGGKLEKLKIPNTHKMKLYEL